MPGRKPCPFHVISLILTKTFQGRYFTKLSRVGIIAPIYKCMTYGSRTLSELSKLVKLLGAEQDGGLHSSEYDSKSHVFSPVPICLVS